MRKHVNARCKDLLEVTTNEDDGDTFFKYKVDFMHRIVRDFLMTKSILSLLRGRTAAGFNPRTSLCRMLLAQIKVLPLSIIRGPRLLEVLMTDAKDLMVCASEIELECNSTESTILDELHRMVSVYAGSGRYGTRIDIGGDHYDLRLYDDKMFLEMALSANLQLYVTQKLNSNPHLEPPLQFIHRVRR